MPHRFDFPTENHCKISNLCGDEHIEKGVEPANEMLVLQEKILREFAEVVLVEN